MTYLQRKGIIKYFYYPAISYLHMPDAKKGVHSNYIVRNMKYYGGRIRSRRSKKEKKTMKQMIQNLNKNKLKKIFPNKIDRYYALEMPEKYFIHFKKCYNVYS